MPAYNNLRPGVYSGYDITSYYAAPRSQKYAAVVAKANGGEPGTVYHFTGYAEACEVFLPDTEGKTMLGCLRVLFASGVSGVVATAVQQDYEPALELIAEVDNIGAVVCDAADSASLALLRQSVEKSARELRERIAFCGLEAASAAITAAQALNNERVVLACPAAQAVGGTLKAAAYTAAALAGAVLAQSDSAQNYNGLRLGYIQQPEKLAEADIQLLLAAGVSVVENVNGAPELIRALTTKTQTGGVSDRSLCPLNTILIIDEVLSGVRNSLKLRLRGARLAAHSLESVRTQVLVELDAFRQNGILESFLPPNVYGDSADPSVCVVELAFKVAHVLSQIHITAHIQV